MPYFHISSGLRGCYMPDNAFTVRCDTRAALKEYLIYEANSLRDAEYIGGSKRAIATIAAQAWRDRRKTFQLPVCIPFAPGHSRGNYCYGVFVAAATRAEYDEYQEGSE